MKSKYGLGEKIGIWSVGGLALRLELRKPKENWIREGYDILNQYLINHYSVNNSQIFHEHLAHDSNTASFASKQNEIFWSRLILILLPFDFAIYSFDFL